ncbi:PDZ domain-containing protein [Streptomyces alfalfae]|uniref:Peptidase S41 n=1 Tax=Streptomyces alfalfae TaxID=1642299 RepID=A0ABM6GV97_9ACTN|nr:S41 family peptidase [Streptomyces alfalfae]APY88031.1 peptidase S41 [Streptomyces alfalfae]AYA18412.1 PDZ domain-containing protein [Streptomyces fradiae]RXX46181.1 PDZ domain-containing protein [Streptomyces alfalfae]RZM92150.1 PDZ domain-containing protein [Streptomyces alfalfae]
MSGLDRFVDRLSPPRRVRRGAALALVFASVLVTGAATGSWSDEADEGRKTATPSVRPDAAAPLGGAAGDAADAAAEAMADGKSAEAAAEEAVSRSGDRWGSVYSHGEFQKFEQALDGAYTGVGLWARRAADGRIEVSRVSEGGPAALAGIRAGDRLRSVDGRRVAGRPVTEVVSLLRGDRAGTPVELGLERGTRAWSETLRRARLSTDSVRVAELSRGARVIKIDAFTKGSGEAVREAVREAPEGAGILLDLRGNSGGLVSEAVTAASALVDGGLVATYDVRGEEKALHAERGGDTGRPVVALVDGGTMSAAELLTGALQDRGRAVVVGTRTFGKGSVQMPSRLPDGSVAELTVGHYRTPSGRAVDGRGITPDLEAEDGAEARAETVLTGLGPPS